MSREYKNIIKRPHAYGPEERKNLAKEVMKDSTPLPNPLDYKDIDEEFKNWVENSLDISFEDEKLPTIALFSNQRFSEYMQSWENVDDKKNLILNFKAITRENNPKAGSVVGQSRNIPGDRTFLMKRVEARDRNGRRYFIDYRMKQPISIDMMYTVTLVTNKYELLNQFNIMMNEKFKAITCYIWPKDYPIPMNLQDISDESEYSIDDRQFYSQSYLIKVMAYIMPEDSFEVVERPEMKFIGFEGDRVKTTYAEIEELPCGYFKESPYAYVPINITIHFDNCTSSYKFTLDCNFGVKEVKLDNVRSFKIFVNDKEVSLDENFRAKEGDEIRIKSLTRKYMAKESEIKIEGFDPYVSYKKGEEVDIKDVKLS